MGKPVSRYLPPPAASGSQRPISGVELIIFVHRCRSGAPRNKESLHLVPPEEHSLPHSLVQDTAAPLQFLVAFIPCR